MKTTYALLLLLITALSAKPDTITHYHLFLGDSIIGRTFGFGAGDTLVVQLTDTRKTPSLSVFKDGCFSNSTTKFITLTSPDSSLEFGGYGVGESDDRFTCAMQLPPTKVLKSQPHWTVRFCMGPRQDEYATWYLKFE